MKYSIFTAVIPLFGYRYYLLAFKSYSIYIIFLIVIFKIMKQNPQRYNDIKIYTHPSLLEKTFFLIFFNF